MGGMSEAEALRDEILADIKNVARLQRLVALVSPVASAEAEAEAVRITAVAKCLSTVFEWLDSRGVLGEGEKAAAATTAAAAPAAKRARSEKAAGATAKVGAWALARWDEALAALLAGAADASLAPCVRNAAVDGWVALVARASPQQAHTHVARAVERLAAVAAPEKTQQQQVKW